MRSICYIRRTATIISICKSKKLNRILDVSAFFWWPILVCRRSESLLSALDVEMCMVQHLLLSALSVE
jgi:hypothetical protein